VKIAMISTAHQQKRNFSISLDIDLDWLHNTSLLSKNFSNQIQPQFTVKFYVCQAMLLEHEWSAYSSVLIRKQLLAAPTIFVVLTNNIDYRYALLDNLIYANNYSLNLTMNQSKRL
jgi:hypothetical protein